MPNPFLLTIDKLKMNDQAQGTSNRLSYLFALLTLGAAIHAANPTAWNPASVTAADEVLYRLRALNLGNSFAYAEIARFFAENAR